ncbi:MAG: hypothetical protein PHR30_13255 [Gallionellaceae bacterium]|nr:hypothetical protein [Gallionellaceae bacterium]
MSKPDIAITFGGILAITGALLAKFAVYFWLGATGYLLLALGLVLLMTGKDL